MAAIPISLMIGTPISGLLLRADGVLGLRGWQWMFILDALPAILLAFAVPFVLPDGPRQAKWLTPDERESLTRRLAAERHARDAVRRYSVMQALRDPRVLSLALAYFGMNGLGGGLTAFLPQILRTFGLSNTQSSLVAIIPYFVAVLGMTMLGWYADRAGQRKTAAVVSLLIAAAGLAGTAMTDSPPLKLAVLSFACIGVFGCMPVFWGLPTAFLSGPAAAAGLALINALGSLSNFFNTWAIGRIRDMTESYDGGLLELAGMATLAAIVVMSLRHDVRQERSRVPAAPSHGALTITSARRCLGGFFRAQVDAC